MHYLDDIQTIERGSSCTALLERGRGLLTNEDSSVAYKIHHN
jgi:hypothetical protein